MDSLIKLDIFFFITSLSVVLVTTVLVILILRILPLIREARELLQAFKKEGLEIVKDVHDVRVSIKEHGAIVKNTLSGILAFFGTKKKTVRTKTVKKDA